MDFVWKRLDDMGFHEKESMCFKLESKPMMFIIYDERVHCSVSLENDIDIDGTGQANFQDGQDALRIRAQTEGEAHEIFVKKITAWFLLFAFSDGTAPDFGPSSRGFVESLTGVKIDEPHDQELVMWKSVYSCIHRQSFQFQVLTAYGLVNRIRSWDVADYVLINVFNFPVGMAPPQKRAPDDHFSCDLKLG